MNDTIEEGTKQITFEGQTYTVPTLVKWVARDEDEMIVGYELKPIRDKVQWFIPIQSKLLARNITLGWGYKWRESLIEV